MSLPPGTRLGAYEILAPIGAGGMGEVYRARDTKLKRDVAIKVLPDSLAQDPKALERFEREALAVAALSHPNILAIHDFGREGNASYAVMELLDGETLRARLAASRLGEKTVRDYALQMAKGLAAAHDKGIVHRDLKPENVFLGRDGHVKILDFGLAKRTPPVADAEELSSASTAAPPTEPGTVMGTVGYMSPEQVRGREVDHRSDIFSFGTMLHEMLSGKKPFKRDTAADTMAAILNEEPPPLAGADVPVHPALEQIVRHCLEKNVGQRFQSARDLVFALETLSSAPHPIPPPSPSTSAPVLSAPGRRGRGLLVAAVVAAIVVSAVLAGRWRSTAPPATEAGKPARIVVLPFDNLGGPEDEYLAAGVTEEVSSRLGSLKGLSVISRTTATGYDRKGKTIAQIGADLGVDYVLEGTVQCERPAGAESRVRIAPQLIQVANDSRVWADRYDRTLADIFAIQSEVAESVVKALDLELLPREKMALRAVSTKDREAHALYIRGLEFVHRGETREAQEGALRMFQASVDRDPRFTEALSRLSRMHAALYFFHWDHSRGRVEKARETLDQLSALGPDLPETHSARGFYYYFTQADYPRALQEFNAALLLQPSNTDVIEGVSYVLRRQGRLRESAEHTAKWLEIDPRSGNALHQHGISCMLLGRYAESDRVLALATRLYPEFANAWARRIRLRLLWAGDADRAQALVSEASQVAGLSDTVGVVALEAIQIALIRRDFRGALRLLDAETRDAIANQFFYLPIDLLRGETHRLAGENDRARVSFEASRSRLEGLIARDPDDSRYHSALGIALAGLGLRDEALRAAKRGTELMPLSTDLWRAWKRTEDLALVHAMLGQEEEAIERLDFLLSSTGEVSTHLLRLDPRYERLGADPRFQAILTKYADRRAFGVR